MASIFELGDVFGLTSSPLGDWLSTGTTPIPGMTVTMLTADYQASSKQYIITFEIAASGLGGKAASVALLLATAKPIATSPTLAKQEIQLLDGKLVGTFATPATRTSSNQEYYLLLLSGERAAASLYFKLEAPATPKDGTTSAVVAIPARDVNSQISTTGGPGTRDLTLEELHRLAPHAKLANVQKHLAGINQACADYRINTSLRKALFLSQLLTESANLLATHEFGSKENLDKKYHGFEGRGLIQLTGRPNYTAYGKAVKEDFVTTLAARTKLEKAPHAARSAGWFWARNGLSVWADTNDFIALTRRINGSYNGYSSRLAALRTILQELANMGYDPGISIDYRLQDSAVYGSARDTFAWGLWHDPGLARNNVKGRAPEAPRDTAEALIGYRRAVTLLEENEKLAAKSANLFGIQNMVEFASVRTKTAKGKPRVTTLDAARLRVRELAKLTGKP